MINLRNWIASLGVLAGMSGGIHADWPSLNWNFRINFGGHDSHHVVMPDPAPWYSYFPQDPNQGVLGQHQSPYPTWPTQYPPSEPSADAVARQWQQQQQAYQYALQQQALQQQAMQQRTMQQYGQPVSYPRPPYYQSIPNYRR